MMRTPRIQGVVPPVPTPLTASGELDGGALVRIFDHLAAGGVDAAFILGSTGELASLSVARREEVIGGAVAAAAGRLPVLVGIADTCMEDSLRLARLAGEVGAAAVVVAAPYYYDLSPDELRRYFCHLLSRLESPVMVYNMPWLTGHDLDEGTLRAVMDFPHLIGFKDSSGDLAYLERLLGIAASRPEVAVLVGNESLYLDGLRLGAHGVVGGGSNIHPVLFRRLLVAFRAGDEATAEACQRRINELGGRIFGLTGRPTSVFVTIKAALSCLGLCEPHVAPPLTCCTPSQLETLRGLLAADWMNPTAQAAV
jgi:dihydrodipicolinate synthase/N-acetylneuraminate lyase